MTVAVLGTIFVAAILIAAMSPLAQKIGLVDHPNARKAHFGDIPLVGGLGIFTSFVVASLVFEPQISPVTVFFVASLVVVAGGLVDDFLQVSPIAKLTYQVVAILLMCLVGGVSVQTVGELVPPFGAISLGFLAIPFTIVAAIGVINAVNLSDGLDGLAGFQTAVAFAALAFLAERAGDAARAAELLLLISCIVGFLVFNARVFGRKKASVFLGDAGTMFLGFAYVWFAIDLSNGSNAVMSPITALWLLAIPICDAVTMMIRRVSRGRSPFRADKEHLHHVLMMAGFTVAETVLILTAMAVASAAIGIAGEVFGVPDAAMFALFVAGAGVYLWVILRSWTVMRFLRWSICRRREVMDRRTNTEQRRAHREPHVGGVERRSGADRRLRERRTRAGAQAPRENREAVRSASRDGRPSAPPAEPTRPTDGAPADGLAETRLQAGPK